MWLSKQIGRRTAAETEMETAAGTVSVGGEAPGVVTDGERRQGRLFSPGGYCWRPAGGETVLVVGGDEPCVAGREQACPVALETGEVYIHSGGVSLWLRNDGTARLDGSLIVSGSLTVMDGAVVEGGMTVDNMAVPCNGGSDTDEET